jgi:competence protein ComEC
MAAPTSAIDRPPSRLAPARTPLLPVLAGLAAGYLLGGATGMPDWRPALPLVVGCLLLLTERRPGWQRQGPGYAADAADSVPPTRIPPHYLHHHHNLHLNHNLHLYLHLHPPALPPIASIIPFLPFITSPSNPQSAHHHPQSTWPASAGGYGSNPQSARRNPQSTWPASAGGYGSNPQSAHHNPQSTWPASAGGYGSNPQSARRNPQSTWPASAGGYGYEPQSARRNLQCVPFLLALLAGWFSLPWRSSTVPDDWQHLPPRAVVLELELERPFQVRAPGRSGGISRIVDAPPHLAELRGRRVSHYLECEAGRPPAPGERFRGEGVLRYLPAVADPDGFQQHLRRIDVHLSLGRGRVIARTAPAPAWRQMVARMEQRCLRLLRMGAPGGGENDVLAAMLLGERRLLDPEREQRYIASGTMHLFAVSGLHVGAVAAALFLVLTALRLPAAAHAGIGLTLLLAYVLVTGAAPSAVRAWLMVLFFWGGRGLGRQSNPFAAWTAAAVAVLLWDPRQLWQSGFQLSYAVVGGILLVGLPLAERAASVFVDEPMLTRAEAAVWWRVELQGLARGLVQTAAVSCAATAFSAPVIIESFAIFTPGAALLNIVMMPLAGLVVATGCLALATGLAGLESITLFCNHSAWLQIRLMELSIDCALLWPDYRQPRAWLVAGSGPALALAALAIAALLAEPVRRRSLPAAALALPLALIMAGILAGSRAL